MKFKESFIKNHSLYYGLICLFANVLAVISTNHSNFPLPEDESILMWRAFLEDHTVLIDVLGVFCYFIPILFCVLYVFRVVKYMKAGGDYTRNENFIKNKVHMPAAFALRGITGWISNFLMELIFLVYFKIQYNYDITFILVSSITSYCFLSMFSFTVIYFTLETLNRNVVLPALYPEGNISGTERMSLSSIRNLFLFYFFSAAVFPASFLGIRLFCTKRYHIEIPNYYDIFYTVFLLFLGLILTFLISGYFQKPLKKLTKSAREISNGNYDSKTVICSNDEMGVLGDTFNTMATSLKEKEFMRDTFGRIVTPQIRDYLLNKNVALGGETLDVTVMFCDIRGFTSLSETMSPEKIVSFLNEYFTGLEKCITAHGGIINKYIGDAVMALFGAPLQSSTHAKDAYLASIDMRAALKEMNLQFEKEGLPEIKFGIGLHSGPVLAGNIGAANRMEYTVIGDTVNTASRIEGLCKIYKKDLLISENTAKLIFTEEENTLSFVDDADIRGKTEKVKVYTA